MIFLVLFLVSPIAAINLAGGAAIGLLLVELIP